jgi:hypothetical protein
MTVNKVHLIGGQNKLYKTITSLPRESEEGMKNEYRKSINTK